MPRKKPPPPEPGQKPKRKTAPIQVKAEIARMTAVICAHDGITQADLLDEYLSPFVTQHYRRVQLEIAENVRRLDAPAE